QLVERRLSKERVLCHVFCPTSPADEVGREKAQLLVGRPLVLEGYQRAGVELQSGERGQIGLPARDQLQLVAGNGLLGEQRVDDRPIARLKQLQNGGEQRVVALDGRL